MTQALRLGCRCCSPGVVDTIASLVSWPRVASGQLLFFPGFLGQASELSRTEYSIQQEVGLRINFITWTGLQNGLQGLSLPTNWEPKSEELYTEFLGHVGAQLCSAERQRGQALCSHATVNRAVGWATQFPTCFS